MKHRVAPAVTFLMPSLMIALRENRLRWWLPSPATSCVLVRLLHQLRAEVLKRIGDGRSPWLMVTRRW